MGKGTPNPYLPWIAIIVSIAAVLIAIFFDSRESARCDQELETLMESERNNSELEEVRRTVVELLGRRLSIERPAPELYKFPIRDFYNATSFTRDEFLAEAEQQELRFLDSFIILREINWDSAVLTETTAVVTAEIQVLRQLHDHDRQRACHDSTKTQSQQQVIQITFERVDSASDLLIVSERSIPLGPVVCV